MRLFVVVLCLASCTEPPRDDQLDRTGPAAPIYLPDGGVTWLGLYAPPATEPPVTDTADHASNCNAPCPGACDSDEICCLTTLQCVRITCPECCPGYGGFEGAHLGGI